MASLFASRDHHRGNMYVHVSLLYLLYLCVFLSQSELDNLTETVAICVSLCSLYIQLFKKVISSLLHLLIYNNSRLYCQV